MTRSPAVLAFLLACTPTSGSLGSGKIDAGRPVDDSAAPTDDSGPIEDSGPIDDTAPPAPVCVPAIALSTPWFTEGDVVDLPVSCTTGADPAAFAWRLESGPEGAALDGGAFHWATDRADAGTIAITVSATPLAGGSAEVAMARFWVAEDGAHPENIPVDPLAYTEEWGLPVFHIQTTGALTGDYVPATVIFNGDTYAAEVKKRGAASFGYPKNSLTLRFADDTHELDVDDYGIPEKKDHIVLVSTFDDNSYARQKLAYDTWAAIAETLGEDRIVIRSFYAVVYLDGAYDGLFVAIDRPDDELMGQMGQNRDGNLYKSYNHDANFKATGAAGGRKWSWSDGYYKKEGVDLGDFSDLNALVEHTASTTPAEFMATASDWIYTPDFMDWWLLVHVIDAGDSGGKNAYLYNDPTQPMSFRYCPWDFNHSFGQDWMTLRVGVETNNDFTWANQIFYDFLNDSAGRAALFDRYQLLRADGPYTPGWFADQLDGYYALIQPSAQRDWDKWGDAYRHYWWADYRSGDWTDFEGEKAYLYDWVADRNAILDERYPPG